MDVPERITRKLRELPDAPGCYLMRDRRGSIIYVGKAASLRKRVRSYFRGAARRGGSPKLRSLVKSIADLEWMVLRNEAEAILTEGRLIKEYKPRYNVSFRDDKRFLLLRADARAAFPRFRLCRLRKEDGARYFGPYASSAAARATLDFTEKRYGIRKCEPALPDAETYRHCINDIVRFCSAPCVGRVDEAAYRERFEEACAFLAGRRPGVLKALRETMEQAAAALDFERAAAYRDTLLMLQAAVRQHARVAPTPAMQAETARAGLAALRDALDLPATPALIEGYDISNISGTLAVASLVCLVDGMPQPSRYRRFRIRTVQGSDDPRMMAEVIGRRFRRAVSEGGPLPDLVLVDGGVTQLRAARKAMDALNLQAVPAVGLAKRFEELHLVGRRSPLRLPRDSAALKLLQRLRDEAHRFALTYHRRLRGRRIRESVLDEVPGIGAKRKQLLLGRMGSLRRITAASEEELAAVSGIGPELARNLHRHLHGAGAKGTAT
jgi:excinuclease ABC subunit C